jgi:hypothetical protein
MLIRSGEDYLELTPVSRTLEHLPGAGNTCFAVRVKCGSFSAETTAYIEAGDLRDFADAMRGLEKSRQGVISLESISPGELRLELRITDRAGHVAAFGQVGGWCFAGSDRHWNVVRYFIPFCPTLLPQMTPEFQAFAEDPRVRFSADVQE